MADEHADAPAVKSTKLLPVSKGRPTTGGRVHDSVVRTMGAWILGGRYNPGNVLPREDDLTESLGVSRTSLREAVKVLCAKGLLEARPRVGVRVREREHWRLLDPIVLGWHPDLTADRELIIGLIETRRIIEPAAAELAARRGTARDFDAIEAAYLGMERAIPHDLAACCESDLAFHRALVDASHNIVLRNLIGAVETALRASFLLTTSLMENQARTLSVHKAVLESVRVRDTAGARSAMNRLLDLAEEDYRRVA
jgi:GntR family transcriptional regulator, galactonate operon transcriptional repressor